MFYMKTVLYNSNTNFIKIDNTLKNVKVIYLLTIF